MTCESFERRLDDLLDGRCTTDQWQEAETHLATCARCRRVFDAVSGRSDDMEAAGHEALSQAIVARTSGSGCAAARDRLCDYVDGALASFDRDLVDGHLTHCPACAELTAVLSETTSLLPSFATLAPRASLVREVLDATSRRPVRPTVGQRVSAWLTHAAERPRFSIEVAYVLTVLLLVVLGNPVDAFKEASVRVQPRVNDAARAVSGPLVHLRAKGEETLTSVEHAIGPKAESASTMAQGRAVLWQWWQTYVDAPVRSIMSQVSEWTARLESAIRKAMTTSKSEPPAPAVR
jgi:predicted anti-sigma-YlaC factor YlaD